MQNFAALLVYVNVVLTWNFVQKIATINKILHSHFHIKNLDLLKYFMVTEVAYSNVEISLCQHIYDFDLHEYFGTMGSKLCYTLVDSTLHLHNDSKKPLVDPPLYQRLVGQILYLRSTRPNITFATQQLI